MGKFPVKEINNYYLVPNLGIGGAAIRKDHGGILLDTGYIIWNTTKGELHPPRSFMNYSKAYVKATRSNVQRDLGEGQLAGQLLQEYETLKLLAAHNCRLNKEVLQMQRWMLTAMTDTSDQYLFHQPGRKVTRIGEAFLLHRCKPITDYQVHWNQSHNGTCYSAFPVTSTSFQGIQFLELG